MPVVETVTTPSISLGRQARLGDRRRGGLQEHFFGGVEIDGIAVVPAVRLLIPFGRRDDVAAGDPGIVEHARQPVEQRGCRPKAPRPRPWPRPARSRTAGPRWQAKAGCRFACDLGTGTSPMNGAKGPSDDAAINAMGLRPCCWSGAGVGAAGPREGDRGRPFTVSRVANFRRPGRWISCPGSGVPLTDARW